MQRLQALHILRAGVLPSMHFRNHGAERVEEGSACEFLWRACGGRWAGAVGIGARTDARVGLIRAFRGNAAVVCDVCGRNETISAVISRATLSTELFCKEDLRRHPSTLSNRSISPRWSAGLCSSTSTSEVPFVTLFRTCVCQERVASHRSIMLSLRHS